jgi:membrane-associated protease RseP (regulator of RpoE activity)
MSDDDTSKQDETSGESEETPSADTADTADSADATDATSGDAPSATDASDAAGDADVAGDSAADDADATVPDVPAAAATPAAGGRSGVFVPRWVAAGVGGLAAVLVIGGAGFAIGRATDDGYDGGRPSVEARPGNPMPGGGDFPDLPTFPDQRDRPDDSDRGDVPSRPDQGDDELPTVPGRRVLLGVAAETASGDVEGAELVQIVSGSPADDAGLEEGDVITAVDDTDVTDAEGLIEEISAHESGDEVTITYERDGETQTVDLTLGTDDEDTSSSN